MSLAYYKKLAEMEKDANEILDQLLTKEQRIKYGQFKKLLKEQGHYVPEKWFRTVLAENDELGLVTDVPQ